MTTYIDTLDPVRTDELLAKHGEILANRYGVTDQRFALWLGIVDQRLSMRTGMGHRDLADWTWRDAFDDGSSPSEAVQDALEDGILS